MKYTFNFQEAHQQFVYIEVEITTPENETVLCMPAWRPGRYELANFSKNIRYLKVFAEGKEININKIDLHSWLADTSNCSAITIKYQYYAAVLNAGSTFLDASQLYVNPVNCCIYPQNRENDSCEVFLNIPEDFQVAHSFQEIDKFSYKAESFHELVDCPFVCSANLQHNAYTVGETKFHLWFNGEVKPEWDKLIRDFEKFSEYQIGKFQAFPVKNYHFIFQILPYATYHGVEHKKSTVITLGPSYAIFDKLYTELLGVSSHELYHTWNVKTIRPIEMMPYDYSKENLSKLGYLCEGVTTYMGDIILLRSGVFDIQQYFLEMTRQLQRHFDNFGRYNYSVAASSFDTWLDGYVIGAPGRKVSIYTEGCLLAFVTDIMIMKHTKNLKNLDFVMRRLYWDFADKGKGVSEQDYKAVIENVAGANFDWLFDDYIHGIKGFEVILSECFEYLGIEIDTIPSPSYSQGRLGLKALDTSGKYSIKAIFPGSPADLGGLMLEDKIIAVNGAVVNADLDKWLSYFDSDLKHLTIERAGRITEITLPEVNRGFYQNYSLRLIDNPNKQQEFALRSWVS